MCVGYTIAQSLCNHLYFFLSHQMMSLDDGRTSPIHVHVDEETPVHVHVKKGKKSATAKAVDGRMKRTRFARGSTFGGPGNVRRPPSSRVRSPPPPSSLARSQSPPVKEPWVPAPGKSTRGGKYAWEYPWLTPRTRRKFRTKKKARESLDDLWLSWMKRKGYGLEGDSARLEINPADRSALRRSDLEGDADDVRGADARQYEKRIDSLMTEMGTLRNEADLVRKERELDKTKDRLDLSQHALMRQEHELREAKTDLTVTERENERLRRSVERLKDSVVLTSSEKSRMSAEKDLLLRKLTQAEMDGSAASQQLEELRSTIRRLRDDKRMTSEDSIALARQKDLLMQRLDEFESTNRTLRTLLQDQYRKEPYVPWCVICQGPCILHAREGSGADASHIMEQKDVLMRRLTDVEADNVRLRDDLLLKEQKLEESLVMLEAERGNARQMGNVQTSLETTRAHLQKELRTKEADNNRMAVQIRGLEKKLQQERIEREHTSELLMGAKDKAERDKEALKKATRVQKQRAEQSENTVDRLNATIMEKEAQIADLHSSIGELKAQNNRLSQQKSQVESENAVLHGRNKDLDRQLRDTEDRLRANTDTLTERVQRQANEVASLKIDNERLQNQVSTMEDKLITSQTDVTQLKSSVRQYENLVTEYKQQPHGAHRKMNASQREAESAHVRLERTELERTRLQEESTEELERVRTRLQQRLAELEPLPELLRESEIKIQDMTDRINAYEKRALDHTKLITELTVKVEDQSSQLESHRSKSHSAEDEIRALQTKVDALQRKLEESDAQNRDLVSVIAKREDTIHDTQARCDELARENSSLSRQLEAAIQDMRRQTDEARDKASNKERSAQNRILDLEAQLSRVRSEMASIKRTREEHERKHHSKLQDLTDRLEQANTTNRSMQNYVSFLKSSYANVFGDSVLTSSPYRSPTAIS
ncbi:ODF2L [Branchiostoma lanceolatum]|uniref:ODF2L protein n=1 Tax=Branchiostoma lanceolatum TaxID=7740 RepID=A0A8K0ADN4_BRALA|nr:ODF2L [Branchiostoma lanceolatum]